MNNALTAPSLCGAFRNRFKIGAAITGRMTDDPDYRALIRRHFSSITAENGMKPERLLDREATLQKGDPIRPAFHFSPADQMLSFARENEIAVRFHTLAWHNQTPRWFFAKNWDNAPDAPLAAPEVMLARLEAYIQGVMEHVNSQYPGTVYAWDVVNEAIEPDQGGPGCYRTKSLWYQTLGENFVPAAFRAARKHQAPGQKLFYNDYSTFVPAKKEALTALLQKLRADNLVDGMGMQAHLQWDKMDIAACEQAARVFGDLGLTLHITEMDIHCPFRDEAHQAQLAQCYRDYFDMLLRLNREGYDVESVSFWGVTDADTWLTYFRKEGSWPLLFTGDKDVKPAFDAVLEASKRMI